MRQLSLLSAALLLAGMTAAAAQTGTVRRGAPPHAQRSPPAGDGTTAQEGPAGAGAVAEPDGELPYPHAYEGGAGSRFSPHASNIEGANTYSEIAPRLPDPYANGDGPRAYLEAAQRALLHRQTGAAQEALERAQTRILSRATDPALANTPDDRGLSRAITDARLALGRYDIRRAQTILAQVLAPRP